MNQDDQNLDYLDQMRFEEPNQYETEMLAMLKEPLGNVRVYSPLVNDLSGASIQELLEACYLEGRIASEGNTEFSKLHKKDWHKIQSRIAARGKVSD